MSQKECLDDEEDAYRPGKCREIEGVCSAHSICHRCLRGVAGSSLQAQSPPAACCSAKACLKLSALRTGRDHVPIGGVRGPLHERPQAELRTRVYVAIFAWPAPKTPAAIGNGEGDAQAALA